MSSELRNGLEPPAESTESNSASAPLEGHPSGSTQKSCPAPIEGRDAKHDPWKPIPLSELQATSPTSWIWDGLIGKSLVSLLVAYPKAGKTTLIAHLLAMMDQGGDLGPSVRSGKVLVVSEEPSILWCKRRDELGIQNHVHAIFRPFPGKPSFLQWGQFIERLVQEVKENQYDLVIFDTFAIMSPATDENDASQMLAALSPLHSITGAGAAVLLVHHLRKSDADQGQGGRGSNALPGFVEVIMELRPKEPKLRQDKRRILTTHSRFPESPTELVLELTSEGYQLIGTVAEAKASERIDVICRILRGNPGLTAKEVRSAWPLGSEIPTPGERTIRDDLGMAVDARLVTVSGSGKAHDPFRYSPMSCPATTTHIVPDTTQPSPQGDTSVSASLGAVEFPEPIPEKTPSKVA